MSRRRRRDPIPVVLTLPPEPPTPDEIDQILLATDEVVGRAGRSGVALILKGSRRQRVLDQQWNEVENFGALSHLTIDQITRKIDWCIHKRWLRLEYDEHIPLLYHSEKGLARAKELWMDRVLSWFDVWLEAGTPKQVWPYIEEIHRDIKFTVLEHVAMEGAQQYVPILRAWFPHEVRKVRMRINNTLQRLGRPPLPHPPKGNPDSDVESAPTRAY